MKQWSKRSTWLTLLAACSLTLLGACGTNNDSTDSSGSATTSSEIATTFTDAMGNKVTVPENPQRVIGSYLEDYLVALEVTPVAQWTVGNDSDQAYLQDKLAEVPRINYDLPFEDVLSFEPDLLLMDSNSMVEGDKYDQYSKIAPTYVVTNGEDVTWRERLTDIAKVLHKEEQAAQVEADYDELVAATKETYADQIQGKSIAVLWVVNNSVFMVSETKSSGQLLPIT